MEAKSPPMAKSPPVGPRAPLPGPLVGQLPVKAPPVTPPWQANALRNEQLAFDELVPRAAVAAWQPQISMYDWRCFVRVYVLRLVTRATQ